MRKTRDLSHGGESKGGILPRCRVGVLCKDLNIYTYEHFKEII